jgi:hypothetical protein
LPQRLGKVVIHPCRETLFAFSLQGVSRQSDITALFFGQRKAP